MTTKVTSGLISADAASVDLNIDAGTLYVDASANKVGIGTTSPSQRLHVDGGSALIKSSYDASGTTNVYQYFATRQNGNWRNSTVGNTGNGLVFGTGGTGTTHTNAIERMRIDSSGNVGIGETAPLGKVHIKSGDTGASSVSGDKSDLVIENNSHAGITTLATDSTESGMFFGHTSDTRAGEIYTRYDTTLMTIGTRMSGGIVRFLSDNGSERMRILAAGGLTFNGDTAAANALDDYEEGTWTPTVSTGIISTTANSSEYTKIGDMVFAQTRITGFSNITSTAQIILGGLPYSVGTTQSHIGTGWGDFSQKAVYFYIGGGAYHGGGGYGLVRHNMVGATTNILVSLVYRHG